MGEYLSMPARVSRRQILKLAGGAGALTALSPILAACGDSGSDKASSGPKRLAFGHPHAEGAFYAVVQAGAVAQAKALGYELLQSRANGELDKQVAEIDTWIAQKVTAMTILALDVNSMAPLVTKARNAGIPFVTYAQRVEGADGSVLFDDAGGATKVGEVAADWIKTKLGGNAKVAFMGDYTIQNNQIRLNGAKSALTKALPNAEIVFEGKGLLAPDALKTTQTLLQKHRDLKVVICGADDGALGASQAFATAGVDVSDVFVAGYDGSKPALAKAISGTDPLRLVAALPLYEIGQQVVTVPDNLVKKSGPKDYNAPYTLVTVDNKAEGQRLIDAFTAAGG